MTLHQKRGKQRPVLGLHFRPSGRAGFFGSIFMICVIGHQGPRGSRTDSIDANVMFAKVPCEVFGRADDSPFGCRVVRRAVVRNIATGHRRDVDDIPAPVFD